MEHVKVGMFNLPGIKFTKGQIPEELLSEMYAWAKENKCGYMMNEWLWSFKSEAQRDWFVLRWNDSIPEVQVELPTISPPAVITASKAKKPRKPRVKKTP
jgi:hypothetical protein